MGNVDLSTYWYIEIPMPSYLRDVDGGTIRFVMQHETNARDEVRIIDEHIGMEFDDGRYGRRGRGVGRYGWTRQSGGGEFGWIFGDNVPHWLASPWDWAWIADFHWLDGGAVLPIDRKGIYSHPHMTTRVILKD